MTFSRKTSLDTRLCDFFGRKPGNPHRLGIELEVEGTNIPNPAWSSKHWKIVPEGSLRDGVEFVSNAHLTVKTLPAFLEDFEKAVAGGKLDMSIRTSTHYHISVSHMTLRELYAIVSAYYLIEDSLVAANGKMRMGNLFCLRARDAEGIFETLLRGIKENSHFNWEQNLRYAAQNIASLSKFGTLEYRFVRGLTNTKEIELWARNLYNMVQVGQRLGSVTEVLKLYRSKTYIEFFKTFFTDDFIRALRPYMLTDGENLPNVVLLERTLREYEKTRPVKRNISVLEDLEEIREFELKPQVLKTQIYADLAHVIPTTAPVAPGAWTTASIDIVQDLWETPAPIMNEPDFDTAADDNF